MKHSVHCTIHHAAILKRISLAEVLLSILIIYHSRMTVFFLDPINLSYSIADVGNGVTVAAAKT